MFAVYHSHPHYFSIEQGVKGKLTHCCLSRTCTCTCRFIFDLRSGDEAVLSRCLQTVCSNRGGARWVGSGHSFEALAYMGDFDVFACFVSFRIFWSPHTL